MLKALIPLLILITSPLAAQQVFQHVTKAGNIRGSGTYMDHSAVNKNPKAIILVSQVYGTFNNTEVGVIYDKLGRWAVVNMAANAMPTDHQFNVLAINSGEYEQAFVHIAKKENISGSETVIDASFLDNQPKKMLFVTRYASNKEAGPLNVYYQSGKWRIQNLSGATMTSGMQFNILALDPGEQVMNDVRLTTFSHVSASDNVYRNVTYIDNELTNEQPDAALLFMQAGRNAAELNPKGLLYTKSLNKRLQWALFNQDKSIIGQKLVFGLVKIEKITETEPGRLRPVSKNKGLVFYDLRSDVRSTYQHDGNTKLNFIFISDRPASEANCTLRNGDGEIVFEEPLPSEYGFNFFELDLAGLAEDDYTLQAGFSDDEIKAIRFKLNL